MSQQRMPLSADASRTRALNIDGSLFQKWCAEELRKSWRVVAEEYPVSFASAGSRANEESTIDALAVLMPQFRESDRVALLVECKKADPGLKEWVFFLKGHSRRRPRHVAIAPRKEYKGVRLLDGNVPEIADYGRELCEPYRQDWNTKTTSARIQAAARQASIAVRSLAREFIQTPAIHDEWAGMGAVHLIPVVVTTARLLVSRTPVAGVDPATGEVPLEEGKFEELEHIIYEQPLWGGLHFHPDEVRPETGASSPGTYAKLHVLIVRATALGTLAAPRSPLQCLIEGW